MDNCDEATYVCSQNEQNETHFGKAINIPSLKRRRSICKKLNVSKIDKEERRRPGQIPDLGETTIRLCVEYNGESPRKLISHPIDNDLPHFCKGKEEDEGVCVPFLNRFNSHSLRLGKLRYSIPFLLNERGIFISSREEWKRRILSSSPYGDEKVSRVGAPWRGHCQRRIPFQKLGTPRSDAVLAIDPSGSYMICVGGNRVDNGVDKDESHEPQSTWNKEILLALRFYGVPSPSKQTAKFYSNAKLGRRIVSPLLLTIPVAYQDTRSARGEFAGDWETNALAPPPVLFPIRIWISSDGELGAMIARLWHHEGWSGCSGQARVIVFPLPNSAVLLSSIAFTTHTLVLDKIQVNRMGQRKPSNDANLLWNVTFVPCMQYSNTNLVARSEKALCTAPTAEIMVVPAYLFMIDEDDGYRLNWIRVNNTNDNLLDDENVRTIDLHGESAAKWRTVENLIVPVLDHDSGWEDCWSDRQNGLPLDPLPLCGGNKLSITYSAFLSIIALLQDILIRYPKLSKKPNDHNCCHPLIPTIPLYAFDVVAVHDSGRIIEILLMFTVPCSKQSAVNETKGTSRSSSVGVFILIDVLTQKYKDISWLKTSSSSMDGHLDQIGDLTLERRRKQVKEYIASPCIDGTQESHECELAELYPNCQSIDNVAVREQCPVHTINARSAPLELYYA